MAVVVDIDLVDQTEFVNVGWDLGIVDGFQRRDDVGGERSISSGGNAAPLVVAGALASAKSVVLAGAVSVAAVATSKTSRLVSSIAVTFHANKSCALVKLATRASTSSSVLYIANEARHVAVTPSRSIKGCAQ